MENIVKTGGYKYSYIKQYIGTVRRISNLVGDDVEENESRTLIADTE